MTPAARSLLTRMRRSQRPLVRFPGSHWITDGVVAIEGTLGRPCDPVTELPVWTAPPEAVLELVHEGHAILDGPRVRLRKPGENRAGLCNACGLAPLLSDGSCPTHGCEASEGHP